MAPYVLAVLAAACVAVLAWGVHLVSAGRPAPDDLLAPASRKPDLGPLAGLADRLGGPLTPLVLRLTPPSARPRLRERIDAAGRPSGMTVDDYARQKAGNVTFNGCLAIVAVLIGQPILALLLLAVGWSQIDLVLWSKARERQEQIERILPDFLDVLAVVVSAGLGFRQAVERVAESMPGPLAEEMNGALRQMALGVPRREAFEELRRRNGSRSLASFVTAIMQAEELGAPLAGAVVEISGDMRREAAQQARRRAQRAEPRITMVTSFVMVPGVLILTVGAMFFGMHMSEMGGVFG
ncbi:DUF5936 domain-containing protein [Actinoallomurus iriomotensis]|uniref:Membrane protein n=1 Tax=Actinoallomurus iriomotensis TaxID=478107 RepID=A0A9W6W022_9ACTN|nr:DUF5936 domain-containing protein [Actinoallomurus iriomotensis]GLY85312.1 membrane protein [Actinoallomurus iriomotensis]